MNRNLVCIDSHLASAASDPVFQASSATENLFLFKAEEVAHALGFGSCTFLRFAFNLLLLKQAGEMLLAFSRQR